MSGTEEQVEKILRDPVWADFSPATQRLRTYVILLSSISLVVGLYDLRIADGSTIIGLRLEGLDDHLARRVLFVTLAYSAIHFVWSAWDSFAEWRLRITGTRTAYTTASFYASSDADYPSDPRQSTLSNWWADRASMIGSVDQRLENIERALESLKENCAEISDANERTALENIKGTIQQIENRHTELRNAVKAMNETLVSNRLAVSLRRFDSWQEYFLRSQNLRWIIIELGLPALLSGTAIAVLWHAL